MKFTDLPLRPELMAGIEDAGFVDCTPIQAAALPHSLDGDDIAGQAQTGTGKTACFLITAFTRLLESNQEARPGHARAICVAPTRELALQIADDAFLLGKHTDFCISTIYGGVSFDKQRRDLERGIDLLIGTPGRILDFLRRRELRLDKCEVAIVDEADRMFDMGFINDLRYILRSLPPKEERQTMLFSATMSFSVQEFGYQFLNKQREIAIEPESVVVDKIHSTVFHVAGHEKLPLILGLLNRDAPEQMIIFCNRKRSVERVAERLQGNGFAAEAITGDLPQKQRQRVIDDFKAGLIPILVATDVASRGIHADGVSHVINYDVPQDAEDYVHRIGRTGRMGSDGRAYTLACQDYVLGLPAVEKYIGAKLEVERLTDDMFLVDESPPPPRRHRSGGRDSRDGRRPGGGGGRGGPRPSGGPSRGRGQRTRSRR